jgi:hypothetical protein
MAEPMESGAERYLSRFQRRVDLQARLLWMRGLMLGTEPIRIRVGFWGR